LHPSSVSTCRAECAIESDGGEQVGVERTLPFVVTKNGESAAGALAPPRYSR